MATIPTPGPYSSANGFQVFDAAGNTRVIMGIIGAGSYGLKVVAADGTTVIIDGTSDIFKIAATGTTSVTGAAVAGVTTTTSVTLNALGIVASTPAWEGHIGPASSLTALDAARLHGFTFAGGNVVYPYDCVLSVTAPGTHIPVVNLAQHDGSGLSLTQFARYYVFSEAGL